MTIAFGIYPEAWLRMQEEATERHLAAQAAIAAEAGRRPSRRPRRRRLTLGHLAGI